MWGPCAAFKVTCAAHGYTIVVSREVDIYRILHRAQGSAIPVFLGAIDLAKVYFLHGAGDIRHMLLMGWGGVIHEDLRPENILWNAGLYRALVIDFHRCALDQQPTYKRPGSVQRRQCGPQERECKRVRVS
ncbi:hypothetical protein BDQ94DRAFT_185686 [Aspergillus welwitschiae]|uniref:Protein kinase domain-containing protein n=1 Tax=Aspergillus welwitschiae TaxID=1341132 RepID=A0A3F3PJ33_9EURO|nr:hypothetical protein BDQ94DRAFT_185686 [Aspergillus welwitschiae]RDH26951.1 hypothetical protein BDQ94DRAFT_185686 [Aspergillus welwitschiae]